MNTQTSVAPVSSLGVFAQLFQTSPSAEIRQAKVAVLNGELDHCLPGVPERSSRLFAALGLTRLLTERHESVV